jgi:hypothetical protein
MLIFTNFPLFSYIFSGLFLDHFNLLCDHVVICFTPQAEVDFLGQEFPQEFLDSYRQDLLLQSQFLVFGQKHSDKALNVNNDQFEFHIIDNLFGSVATVPILNNSHSQFLMVKLLHFSFSSSLYFGRMQLNIELHFSILHHLLGLRWLLFDSRSLDTQFLHILLHQILII